MNPRVLVIDNYDSFVYNLVQYLGELGAIPMVYRNNLLDLNKAKDLAPDALLISPGPGKPKNAGCSIEMIKWAAGNIPVLGVCLGHQCIGEAWGSQTIRGPEIIHGKTSKITHDGKGIFSGISSPFDATRYHSLIVEESSISHDLEVTARSENGLIMGLRHREFNVEGLQFHPESVLTKVGQNLISNFLEQITNN